METGNLCLFTPTLINIRDKFTSTHSVTLLAMTTYLQLQVQSTKCQESHLVLQHTAMVLFDEHSILMLSHQVLFEVLT